MVARQRAVARSEARSSAHEKAKQREALAEVARHVEVALGEARHLVAAEGLRAEVEGHRLRPIESGKLRGGGGALNAREWLDSTITGPRARSSDSNGEYPKASAQHRAPSAKTSAAPRRASPIDGCQSSGAL